MAAKDIYHEACRRALEKDGWTITDDPLTIRIGIRDLLIDLGAERMIGAERAGDRIAIEIKSFVQKSAVQDLKEAVGQFILYEDALAQSKEQSDRVMFLAVRQETFDDIFSEPLGQMLLTNQRVRLIVFDEDEERILQWIK